jgi:hypothetical protein
VILVSKGQLVTLVALVILVRKEKRVILASKGPLVILEQLVTLVQLVKREQKVTLVFRVQLVIQVSVVKLVQLVKREPKARLGLQEHRVQLVIPVNKDPRVNRVLLV